MKKILAVLNNLFVSPANGNSELQVDSAFQYLSF